MRPTGRPQIPSSRTIWLQTLRRWWAKGRRASRLRGEVKLAGALLEFQRVSFLASAAELGVLPLLGRAGATLTTLSDASGVPSRGMEAFLGTGEKLRVLGRVDHRYRLTGWARFLAHETEAANVGRLRETHRLDARVWSESVDRLRDGRPATPLAQAGPAVSAASHAVDDCILPVLEGVGLPSGGRILDVGCGDGGHLVTLLSRHPHCHAVGLETDPAVAEIAAQQAITEGMKERLQVICGSVEDFSDDGRFDAVLAVQMLYYLEPVRRPRFFARLKELLHPEGVLVLVFLTDTIDPMTAQYPLLFELSSGLWPPPKRDDIVHELGQAGFARVETRTLTPGAGPVAVLAQP